MNVLKVFKKGMGIGLMYKKSNRWVWHGKGFFEPKDIEEMILITSNDLGIHPSEFKKVYMALVEVE